MVQSQVEREVLYEDSGCTIWREVEGQRVSLIHRSFPLGKNYGNGVTTEICLKPGELAVYMYWDGWAVDGSLTGSKTSAKVEISEEEYKSLREKFMAVRKPKDFWALEEKIREMEDARSEAWEEAINAFIDEISVLDTFARRLAEIKDEETRKRLIEDLKEYVDRWFDDC